MPPKKPPAAASKTPAKGSVKQPAKKSTPTKTTAAGSQPVAATAAKAESNPGITLTLRELNDVLMQDVGNKIAESKKSALIIDPSSRAATFLRHRDTNYLSALDKGDMEAKKIRLCLLGAVRFGKPAVLDMVDVDLYETCLTRFNEVEQGLFDSLLDQSFVAEKKYLKLIRDGDDDVYNKNAFDDSMVGKFIFCVVTSKADPSETMLAKMYPIRIAE